MPATPQPDKDDAHQQLLDQMDTYYLEKPFRTSNWKPGRNKNLKQILSEASRREASVLATQNNSGASTPLPPPSDISGATTPLPNMAQATQSLSTLVLERNLQKAANANGMATFGFNLGPAVTYTNIESAPSLSAAKKHYCDITGLPARYTDPKTKLRYYNQEMFGVVRTLPPGGPDQYLAARGANRIKGAIDSRIAEEQARQAKQQQQVRQTPRRRPPGQDASSARLSSRQRDAPFPGEKGSNPDPSEFEPEFAIGTDESAVQSRVATPKPEITQADQASEVASADTKETSTTEEPKSEVHGMKDEESDTKPLPLPDLAPEVKARLRKLDRLESKYTELLRAYRTAHTRVQIIEPFEAALRENTPLTSISDPSALVEYLSQLNLKSDMVLEELKRVSSERDQYKKKCDESETEATRLRLELAAQKTGSEATPVESQVSNDNNIRPGSADGKGDAGSDAVASPKSTSSRVPSLAFFSPKTKSAPFPKESSEDLFSYDSEVPRLESELNDCHSQIETLGKQVESLQADLKVARESTEGMVQTLENSSREVNTLREAKDKFETVKADLEHKISELEIANADNNRDEEHKQRISELQRQIDDTNLQILTVKERADSLEADKGELQEDLRSSKQQVEFLNQRLSQKDHTVKDLEDSLAMAKAAEREESKRANESKSQEKRIATMQGLVDNLRTQVNDAESAVSKLQDEIKTKQAEFENKLSTRIFGVLDSDVKLVAPVEKIQSRDQLVDYLVNNLGLQPPSSSSNLAETGISSQNGPPSNATSTGGKKKKNKKGKAKATQNNSDQTEIDVPVKVSEDLSEHQEGKSSTVPVVDTKVQELEQQVIHLRSELEGKEIAFERLAKQIKDQELLQEEIEILRDDLLHQGEEHVEARDKLKTIQTERDALQKTVENLEKESIEAQKKLASNIESEEAHQNLLVQFEEMKIKSTSIQTDLDAAQQLASARFKDLTDLRELLNKAQPEIRSLRSEVEELKNAKEELRNKTGELSRLEAKHEELKTEMKNLGKRLSEQDSQAKDLQKKIEQESKMREKVEGDLTTSQSEARNAEEKRKHAVNLSEETAKELAKSKEEASSLRNALQSLEERLGSQERQMTSLKEEVSLKTALHSSSQSLLQSLRDQTHELNIQAREASSRAENLEEELSEAQRMLSERTREGQTMRMLLNQSESGSEGRLREMKERMDTALEERDRIEDEANLNSRRMMREVEEAKNKAREAQRQLKVVEDERDELDNRSREWKRRREDLERNTEASQQELEEVRSAMEGLREALNESERQVRDAEAQRSDLRRQIEEANGRIEKLSKANKNLTDEIKTVQSQTGPRKASSRPGLDSGRQSSRTSMESGAARSPAPTSRTNTSTPRLDTPPGAGLSQGTVDYVYLKNVLLQFLTQKDKGHQRQLIPVLGMLLHFDQNDEQKWNAVISTR